MSIQLLPKPNTQHKNPPDNFASVPQYLLLTIRLPPICAAVFDKCRQLIAYETARDIRGSMTRKLEELFIGSGLFVNVNQ